MRNLCQFTETFCVPTYAILKRFYDALLVSIGKYFIIKLVIAIAKYQRAKILPVCVRSSICLEMS